MEVKIDVYVSLLGTYEEQRISVEVPEDADESTANAIFREAAENWLFEKINFTFELCETQ